MAGDALLGREMGRYRVESIIGSGGFATVYRAIDLSLQRPVALKVVDPTAHRNPTVGRRFVLEGRAVASLDHPAIVPVFDAGENDGVLWMAMRLIAGGSLDDALVAGRRLTFEQVAAVVGRIGDALDHAHGHGVVHRDVKPSNILLEQNDPARAWLADFGIAATTRTAGRYTTGALGTAAYMAPEQARPSSVGPPADLYSLGCVAYELLTRRRPFPGDDYVELLVAHATHPVPPTVWPRVDAFLQRALAKDPAARPPSGLAFAQELRRTLDDTHRTTRTAPLPGPGGPAGPDGPGGPGGTGGTGGEVGSAAGAASGGPASPGDAGAAPERAPFPPPSPPAAPDGTDVTAAGAGRGSVAAGPGGARGGPAGRPPRPPPHRPGDPVGRPDPTPGSPGAGAPGAAGATNAPPDGAPTVADHVDKTLEHPGVSRPPPPAGPPPAWSGGHGTAPPAPRDPTVMRTGRRRGRQRLIAGGVLMVAGVVAASVTLLDQRRKDGAHHVDDPAGISYDVPAGWSLGESRPPEVVFEVDGTRAATITRVPADGRSAADQLGDADPDVCEADPQEAELDIPGAEQVARCVNSSPELPDVALGAVAAGQFWVVTVTSEASATDRDELLGSIELRALDPTP